MSDNALKANGASQKEVVRTNERRVVFTPSADILELPDELVLVLDMPGVKAENVDVQFERGELTVQGKREPLVLRGTSLVEEFDPGDYYRAFLISQDVAADRISAELKNGVLTIHLPRAEAARPRRISVTAG